MSHRLTPYRAVLAVGMFALPPLLGIGATQWFHVTDEVATAVVSGTFAVIVLLLAIDCRRTVTSAAQGFEVKLTTGETPVLRDKGNDHG